jgi:hypothetical protein
MTPPAFGHHPNLAGEAVPLAKQGGCRAKRDRGVITKQIASYR